MALNSYPAQSNATYDPLVVRPQFTPEPIDHSRGRIQLLNGHLFYSPNCQRDVVVPEFTENPHRIIFKLREVRHQQFLKPRWYTSRSGFLSFLTLRPIDTGYPFDRLAGMPTLYEDPDGKFVMSDERRAAWSRLELNLIWSTANLRDHLGFFADRPFAPWAFAYNYPAPFINTMKRRVRLSQDWFQIWIALLSYLIARTPVNYMNPEPEWYSTIRERGRVDESFLQGVSSSNALNFSGAIARVGTFLDLEDKFHLRDVGWLVDFNIPVWYRISCKITDLAHGHPMSHLVPPPEILDAFLQPSPSRSLSMPRARAATGLSSLGVQFTPRVPDWDFDADQTIHGASDDPSPASGSSSLIVQSPYVSWQEFLARRGARNKERLARENPKQREIRLNRERQPPTRKTRVFEWDRGNDPEDDRLYRQLIPQKLHQDYFENYSKAQSIYDAFTNEWDLCEEFGPGDSDSDTSDDEFDALQDLGTNAPTESSIPDVRPTSPTNFDDPHAWNPPFPELNTPFKALALRFGFVHPLKFDPPIPSNLREQQKKSWLDVLRLAGVPRETETEYPAEQFWNQNILSFFEALQGKQRPSLTTWDLHHDNRNSIFSSELLSRVEKQSNDFLFQFPGHSGLPWVLAVTNVVDMLHVCRVQQDLKTLFNVARYLIGSGFRFRTLSPLKHLPATPYKPPVLLEIPSRRPGYVFTRKDYQIYEQQRAALLASRRGRAFLLRGGISWRLASESLSVDDALTGPSTVVTVLRNGYCIRRGGSDQEFWDDDLSDHELALLSGLYRCYTGEYLTSRLA
jgi:hypothetical protein